MLHSQTFDLTTGRVPVVSLDGLWRFHTGDNPAWADPSFDDSNWPLLRSDNGWDSQGYKGYSGLAWYRFQVTVPAELEHISLFLPKTLSSYEVYADGRLIANYGKMPPHAASYSSFMEYQAYALPARKPGQQKIVVALRVWKGARVRSVSGGGPQHGGGLLGDTGEIEKRSDLERAYNFRGFASSQMLVLLETLAGLGTLALFALRRKEPEYLWFSLIMFSSAANNWVFVYLSAHFWSYQFGYIVQNSFQNGIWLASIAFYQRLLQPRRARLLLFAVSAVTLSELVAVLQGLSGFFMSRWFENLIYVLCILVFYGCIFAVVLTRARQRSLDARLLVAPVFVSALTNCLEGVAWTTNLLGWQSTFNDSIALTSWPFTIDISEAAEELFLLAVFGILILRFTRTRSQEERFAGEVQSAQSVQQYLIPAQLPLTPGFTIKSEYRPAREVGGDFFQVLPDQQDGSVLIVVGDVAGKGLEAGMLATLIVGAIRTAVAFTADPRRIIALLNERLQGRSLVTCLALRIERDGTATLVSAGHLPPYLNDKELPMDGAFPLGAVSGIEFPVMQFHLSEHDSLMLISDGVAEAQDTHGHLFGFDRIGAMLSVGATAASLATAAQTFGQEDDITVLTVERTMPGHASIS
jgi:hypothetical protein